MFAKVRQNICKISAFQNLLFAAREAKVMKCFFEALRSVGEKCAQKCLQKCANMFEKVRQKLFGKSAPKLFEKVRKRITKVCQKYLQKYAKNACKISIFQNLLFAMREAKGMNFSSLLLYRSPSF